jgi:multicomponent Na+:H+ antiporter subunit D
MFNLVGFVLLPILAGMLIYFLPERLVKGVSLAVQTLLLAAALHHFILVRSGGMRWESLGGWTDQLGIVLRSDLLSAVMMLLTTSLFLLFLLYSFSQDYVRHLFVALLLLQQGLMLAVFLTGDLFNLYVILEAISLVITLLIQFKRDKRSVYDGLVYLMINTLAMVFYLFGLGMIYRLYGVLDMQRLTELIRETSQPRQLILPFALMLTAVTLKAALFPLFSWLPKAHGTPGAPSVVSALLSGLSVKMGLYLFIRLQSVFSSQINLSLFFIVVGFITGLAGAWLALKQTDIKRILAYSTISQLGLILIGISYGTDKAFWGAIYHLINHALFKSALFLTAGLIVEIWGSRDIRQLSGIARKAPFITATAILAILGITGAPLFNGSLSKYLISSGLEGSVFEYGLILVNLGTMTVFVRFSAIFFKQKQKETAKQSVFIKIPLSRQIVVGILGLACFVGGLFGSYVVSFLFDIDVRIDLVDYLVKLLVYLATFGAGFLLCKAIQNNRLRVLTRPQKEPGFNQMALAVAGWFAVLFTVLIITVP